MVAGYNLAGVWGDRAITQPPGELAREEPIQTNIESPKPILQTRFKAATITPLAKYEITARVLSKERYSWDAPAKYAPVDIAVGWGLMSDSAVLDKLTIAQSGRWYTWRASDPATKVAEINKHAANMHLIAADKDIEKQINKLRPGAVVKLRGYLVKLEASDGFSFVSSLSRDDSGGGACEVMWVESVDVQ